LGGLFTSTLLNMVVIPTLYNKIEERREQRATKAKGEAVAVQLSPSEART
jgi:hypothetical protein